MTGPKLSPKQLGSIRDASGRVNLWHGAIRSGKTIGSILRFLLFVAAVLRHSGELVIIGRTRDSAWRNVIAPMQDPALYGPIAHQVNGNYGAPTVTILGRRVYVLGASDAKAEKVLRGLTVLGAYVDEATTIPEEFFRQLLGRMSPPGAKLFGTTNPDSPSHWLKKMIDQKLPNWRVFHFTLDDNPSLDQAYVTSIKAEYTGLWYKRFIQGLWVQAEGAIYDMWDEKRHVLPHAEMPRVAHLLGTGIDYGTTNATRGYAMGVTAEPVPRLAIVDEWAPKRGTDAQLSQAFRAWLEASRLAPDWHFVDPAAASFKLQLFHDGLTNVANASNDVLAGIRCVASLLSVNRLVVSDRCAQLIHQLPGYVWDPKATERGQDAPLKVDDHEADALRYVAYSTRGSWRSLVPVTAAADTAPGATDND